MCGERQISFCLRAPASEHCVTSRFDGTNGELPERRLPDPGVALQRQGGSTHTHVVDEGFDHADLSVASEHTAIGQCGAGHVIECRACTWPSSPPCAGTEHEVWAILCGVTSPLVSRSALCEAIPLKGRLSVSHSPCLHYLEVVELGRPIHELRQATKELLRLWAVGGFHCGFVRFELHKA
jgi:hypothetical protein